MLNIARMITFFIQVTAGMEDLSAFVQRIVAQVSGVFLCSYFEAKLYYA
jgi:hypothetical protein